MLPAQPDRGPGEQASVYRSQGDIFVAAGPHARREPLCQPQQLISRGVCVLADLHEIGHGINTAARVVRHLAGEPILDNQCRGAELSTSRQRSSAKRSPNGPVPGARQPLANSSAWCTAASGAPSPRSRRGKSPLTSTALRARRSGWSHAGFLLMGSGTSPKLCPRSSCRGARTPLCLNRRLMAAHARATVAISSTSRGSAPGADVLWCRCISSACQLISRPATPRERQAGSLIGICSRPPARRRSGEGCGELTLIVAAAAVAELLVLPDGGLAKPVWQSHELLDVLRQRLHHRYHWMRIGTAPASRWDGFSASGHHQRLGILAAPASRGEQERCRGVAGRHPPGSPI
jgi:hypothetical protein